MKLHLPLALRHSLLYLLASGVSYVVTVAPAWAAVLNITEDTTTESGSFGSVGVATGKTWTLGNPESGGLRCLPLLLLPPTVL